MSNPQPIRTYPFKQCVLRVWSEDHVDTLFFDGLSCPAQFEINPDTLMTAQECGYGTAGESEGIKYLHTTEFHIRQMHLEHELLHTFLSQELGRPYSLVLRRVAQGETWSYDQTREDEEALVLAFQKYLNTAEYTSPLEELEDPYGLATVFKACYR
jgi:hypothetical protein